MAPLHDALVAMGVQVRPAERWGHLPVTVQGPVDVTLDEVSLRGDVSSQYLTALMLIAPYFPNGLRFMLTTPLVSRPYIRITAAVMAAFGVGGVELGDRIITVPAGRYRVDASYEGSRRSANFQVTRAPGSMKYRTPRTPARVSRASSSSATSVRTMATPRAPGPKAAIASSVQELSNA